MNISTIYHIVGTITICADIFFHHNDSVKAVVIIIDFSPLWETMKEKEITQYKLLKSGIDNKTLDFLKKNGNITLLTMERLCKILDCTPNDIVRFI